MGFLLIEDGGKNESYTPGGRATQPSAYKSVLMHLCITGTTAGRRLDPHDSFAVFRNSSKQGNDASCRAKGTCQQHLVAQWFCYVTHT